MVAYDISITGDRTLNAAVVSTRLLWIDSWTVHGAELQCLSVSKGSAPNFPHATVVYHHGEIKQHDEEPYGVDAGLSLLTGMYVRIVLTSDSDTVPQTVTWYGLVLEVAYDQGGGAHGTQTFTCIGLEWLWSRIQITKSIVATDATISDSFEIARPIIFNGGKGDRLTADDEHRENKSLYEPIFVSEVRNPSSAALWTARDIAIYLLEWFAPDDFPNVTYDFSACGELDWYTPTIDSEGRSVWEVLTMIFDRRRGLGWFLDVESDEQLVFHFFSFASSDIALPSGATITANSRQFTLDVTDAVDVASSVLSEHYATEFAQVVARGARRTSTFSLSKTGGTLLNDWTAAMETVYTAAVGAATLAADKFRNENTRQREETKRVYSWFRMNTGGDAYGGVPAFPKIDPTSGSVLGTEENTWYTGLRFLSHLMLKTNVDNSSGLPGTDSTDTNAQAEFLRPFGVVKVDAANNRYQFLDKVARGGAYDEEVGDGGYSASWSVRMQDSAPGMIIETHGMQHLIALNHYNPASANASEVPPELDYDTIIFTVSAQADSYAESKYPSGDPDPSSILYIDVRDRARLDYLVAGTVVGLTSTNALNTALGGWIRDDREYLEDIARAAYEWYKTSRKAIELVIRQISAECAVGDMITEYGVAAAPDEVNSVITQITWNLEQGTTTIQTQFGELDFVGVFA